MTSDIPQNLFRRTGNKYTELAALGRKSDNTGNSTLRENTDEDDLEL